MVRNQFKGLVRFVVFWMLVPFVHLKSYQSRDVGGWRGWYEVAGRCLGFEHNDGHRFFAF